MIEFLSHCFTSFSHFYNFLFKLNILLYSLFIVYSPDIYNQTLTAEQIYKNVSDGVVVIHSYDSNNELSSQGSGVVINDNGYVVTNYHVLVGNDRLEILHNKEIVPYVDIIGIDVEKDILILKIEDKKFPSIKIGDSKTLIIGQRIYAIGSPLGFENSISEGIISGLRTYDDTGKNFIQITASLSPGSSGGAVVNDKGELIGISTLSLKEGQNLNFAIPINDILSVEINSYSKNNSYKNFELFDKGLDELTKGNFKEAIKYYTSFIKEYPVNSYAYNDRGLAKRELGDLSGAIQDFTKAIEINPNNTSAYSNRGSAKVELKDYNGAIQDLNKAIETNPSFAGAYSNRGVVKAYLKDYSGAIQDLNKAIEINPNDESAYSNRGTAKRDLGDYSGAIQDYTKAIEINPNYAKAQFNLAQMYYNGEGILTDKKQAFYWYKKSAAQGNAIAQYVLALMYYNGEASSIDKKQAAYWMRKSYENGFDIAKMQWDKLELWKY